MTEFVEAAVAVILREDDQVLLSQRPPGKPWAEYWEFPGGKIEDGETPLHALQRELHEELGVEAVHAYPWLTRTFAYPERTVKLRFFTVRTWRGEPHGRENQRISWQHPAAVEVSPLLPANAPILDALQLPLVCAITNLHELGEERFFSSLEIALRNGLRLVQVREKKLDAAALEAFAAEVVRKCKPWRARVLLNGEAVMAQRTGADGIHISAARMMALQERPRGMLCGVSCHNAEELAKAAELGLDLVLLSPVMHTLSHPETVPFGWQQFSHIVGEYPLPVYALGGLQPRDMQNAWAHGAHGIAMQRAIWEQ